MGGYNYGEVGGNNYNMSGNSYQAPVVDEITPQKFNMIVGAVLLYGFLINCFMITFCFEAVATMNPIVFLIIYFAMAIAGTIMIHRSDNPVISFIGYNLTVVPLGLVLSLLVNAYALAGYETTIMTAFLVTAIVTIAMMVAAATFPRLFLSMGKTLFVTLAITLVIEIVLALIGVDLGIIDYVMVLIFCGYVGYDWAKANAMPKTVDNAVDCAAELYVDIVNLFIRILKIMARSQN